MSAEERGELIMYQTDDGLTKIDVVLQNETVWLSLDQMADLFQRDKSTISRHIKNVFSEGELDENSVVANFATTASDGKKYFIFYYNLDVVISVGYRVKSLRGTQFRKWANSIIKEYIIKGFAMNDDLLKRSGGGNYFDELLARIRDIRSSEKVFWRKVLDIYATSIDYSPNTETSRRFFKIVQNKMLFAATGRTAAEIISARANAQLPLMGMLAFKGTRPTLQDAFIAKNYLDEEELQTLNHLVSAYLDLAELQAHRKRVMYMNDWITKLDEYLRMTDSGILENAGSISAELAKHQARTEYGKYKALHSNDITPVEQAFLETLDDASKKIGKRQN